MINAIIGVVTGIYNAITGMFGFVSQFIENLVKAVTQFIYYSDYAKGILNIFPTLHVITGTLAIALSIGLVLKILGR